MTHVVTDACVNCKYTDCVSVCPVECFHEGPNFLVINPEVCIDCGICIAECPVEAIVDEKDLQPDQMDYLELNKKLAQHWPIIAAPKDPLPAAEEWAQKKDKRAEILETA